MIKEMMLEGLPPHNPTHIMRLETDEVSARKIADFLGECFDPAETAVAAFEDETVLTMNPPWNVEVYFRTPPDEIMVRKFVRLAAGEKPAQEAIFTAIDGKDWVKASLDGLKPVVAGRFVIHGSHDRAKLAPNKINIEIEAALAFGTGHHGTTYGCLLEIDRRIKLNPPLRNMLDVGTGTGVLAMALAKAVKKQVVLSDIDPVSVETTRNNASLNTCAPLIQPFVAKGVLDKRFLDQAPFDFIVANILPRPLVGMATALIKLLERGGTLVLSGIIPPHANYVINSYSARGLTLVRRQEHEAWVTLTFKK